MEPWLPFLASEIGGVRRRDGVSIVPWNSHREGKAVRGIDYRPEWGDTPTVGTGHGRPSPWESWLVSWPTWTPKQGAPHIILGPRTLAAAQEYIDRRWPMPPWWLELDDEYTITPPVRVV